jgi:nitric oxide reductase large subunit
MAQDAGTYTDDLGVQDSSYLEEPLILNETQNSGSGTTVIIIILVVIVIAVVGYLAMKKKKK